jgi:prepilin peptidase CpaA
MWRLVELPLRTGSPGRRLRAISRRMSEFLSSPSAVVGGVCFTALLLSVSISDIRRRRIPNRTALALALLGVVYSVVVLPLPSGLARAGLGMLVGFALWMPFYVLRMLGAGDVKLFAAAGCWLAPSHVLGAALASALVGGVLSVIGLVLAHGVGLTTFRVAHGLRDPRTLATPLPVPAGRRTLPYGLAMTVGLLISAWFPQWLGLGR